jgi:hypothetical protein
LGINSWEGWMMNKSFVILFLGILLFSSVFGLGITPARTTMDFKEGLKRSVEFEVLNPAGKNMNVIFSVQGELAKYIILPSREASLSPSERSKTFNYEITMPNELTPGLHTAEVFIMEVPSGAEMGTTQVLATLAVVTQLHVHVPYPGKYAIANMVIYNANQDEEVTFVFPVISAGEFDLTSVRANVDIFNKMGEKVDSFSTNTINVPSGQKKEIVHNWKAKVPIGEYLAKATLIYDEGVLNFEGAFSVGSKELELKEIVARNFRLGEIAKLEMLVENKWSELISGAYIETKIKNDRGDIVSKFQSPSQSIEPLSKNIFNSYWDTAGVRVGTYDAEVTIHYADKISNNNLKFKVDNNELTIIGLGYVVSAEKSGGRDALVTVLVVVIALLVLINILWFMIIRKRLKKK